MPYGTIKIDTVTFTDAGVDKSVTLSGLVQNPTFSGNVTVTGTLSGVTVTGTTANFTSGNFTNISGGTHTITSGVFAAGSAASPSITFTGDLNTGIYSPGADQVAISTGGSGRLFVDASGAISTSSTAWQGGAAYQSNGFQFGGTTYAKAVLQTGGTSRAEWFFDSADNYLQAKSGGFYIANTTANPIAFYTNGSERLRIDSSGRLLVGTSSSSAEAKFIVQGGTTAAGGAINIQRNATTASAGSTIGYISFANSANDAGAFISANGDGTWTAGTSHPTCLVFSTTADGASSPTERMRITSGGYFKASNSGSYLGSTLSYHEFNQDAGNDATLIARNTNNSLSVGMYYALATRAANSAYSFALFYSSGQTDLEFNLRGDGNAYADGSWNGGGADYAEYFEWSDGNPDEEDRRGISVVLDGDQIRPAVDGEDPIGVISGNPSVVGDAAWNKWSGKYLRDDFGTYIQEDYEVEDEDGNTVIQQRRKLNPAYDPDQEYVNREQRPEWDCVGLMGKLRIRKGQPTGSRWIKMRDISDSVEEWLVR